MTDNRCFARITTSETKLAFGAPRHYFFQEGRCKRERTPGREICLKCFERKNKPPKYEQDKWHGLVTEPIPEDSHIFEGAWFESKVTVWGKGTEEDMARAKKAQLEARAGILPVSAPVVVPEPVKEAPKRRRVVKKSEATSTPAPVPVPETVVAPSPQQVEAPKRKIRKPKVVTTAPAATTVKVQAVESSQPTLTNIEVVTIRVRPHEHNGTQYFLDSNKLKLYSRQSNGKPGAYVGRWNPSEETVHKDVPDSDTE